MAAAETRILYVEDDPGLGRLVQKRLARHGMVVTLAPSGEDGIARAAATPFDIAITDYRLPGCDGLEVIRALTARHPDLPLVMVSGAGDLRVAVESIKLGAAEYLVKDVEGGYLDMLPAIIGRALDNHRLLLEKRRIEAELAEERALSRMAVESIAQGLTVFDADLRLALCNRQYLRLHDYPEHLGRRGTPLEALLRHNAERGDYGPGVTETDIQGKLARARQRAPFRYERRTAGGRITEISGSPMPDGGFVTVFTDITERKQAEEKIWHQAHHDTLTGLANRALFLERLKQHLIGCRRSGDSFALLLIDLDGFKAVNDTLGHEAGDQLLCGVADRLNACVRASDTVARLGGDEFTVMILDIKALQDAAAIAGTIVDALSTPFDLGGRVARVSASIGIALHPQDGVTDDDLIRKADTAMYAAKSAGKGRFMFSR